MGYHRNPSKPSAYLLIPDHALCGHGGFHPLDGGLVDIRVQSDALEASHEVDNWNWKDATQKKTEGHEHCPSRVQLFLTHGLKVETKLGKYVK